MSNYCAVLGCSVSSSNKPRGVYLHSCPRSSEMRNAWLVLLKNKCALINWNLTKICSKHFENKYFDANRQLKDNAMPTLFPVTSKHSAESPNMKTKLDRQLSKMQHSQLSFDIKASCSKLKEVPNIHDYVNDNLQPTRDAPDEVKLWLIIKKQEHLINRLTQSVSEQKTYADIAKKDLEAQRTRMKELEKNSDSQKYIIKSLQEKQATLEEEIEILTAVEMKS